VPLGNGLMACDTKVIRLGRRDSILGGIMIGAGKATSAGGESATVAYYPEDGQPGITETGRFGRR
jgi:hypothetical protein